MQELARSISCASTGGKIFLQKKLIVKKTFKLVRRFEIIVKSTFIDAGYDCNHAGRRFHSE
jgi:hypothetical protein